MPSVTSSGLKVKDAQDRKTYLCADHWKIVKKALEWAGYQVETAASGEEAIQKITEWGPQLVLLDVNMPGLNGLQTLQFLRNCPEYEDGPL